MAEEGGEVGSGILTRQNYNSVLKENITVPYS
jgi:hypothetical protein